MTVRSKQVPSSGPIAADSAKKRTRLPPQEREQLIVAGAIRFFAEHGLSGDTRSLAKELGITQSLLYRYFPNKESLIERVYRDIFVGRWNPNWEYMIADRSKPLRTRLQEFFIDYARPTLDRDWIRIFFFCGLKGLELNKRFLGNVRERVLLPICREMRFEFGHPSAADLPISEFEVELVFGIVGRIAYFSIRKWIYQTPVPKNLDEHIRATVDVFFGGVREPLALHLDERSRKSRNRRRRQ